MFFSTNEEKFFYFLSLSIPFLWSVFGPQFVLLVWIFIMGVFIAEDVSKGNFTNASVWTGSLIPIICWGVFVFVDLPKFIARLFRG